MISSSLILLVFFWLLNSAKVHLFSFLAVKTISKYHSVWFIAVEVFLSRDIL